MSERIYDLFDINKVLLETGAVCKGHFVLSSGLHSDTYVQCASLFKVPRVGREVCRVLAAKVQDSLQNEVVDLVVAPAVGAIIVGYEVANVFGIDNIFLERVDGVFCCRRDFEIPRGANVLLVEDVVTTGKSSMEVYECVKAAGANVIMACSVINRGNEVNMPFPLISLLKMNVKNYTSDNLPEHLIKIPAILPGSRFMKSKKVD